MRTRRFLAALSSAFTLGLSLNFGGFKWVVQIIRYGLDILGLLNAPADVQRMFDQPINWPVVLLAAFGITMGLWAVWPRKQRQAADNGGVGMIRAQTELAKQRRLQDKQDLNRTKLEAVREPKQYTSLAMAVHHIAYRP